MDETPVQTTTPEAEVAKTDTPKEAAAAPQTTTAATENHTLLAILAYIGPLIVISYYLGKEVPFVKFHIKQGLLLIIGEVATWMVAMMIWPLFPITQIINIFLFVLAVTGIIRAARGEMRELPLIGHWATKFNF